MRSSLFSCAVIAPSAVVLALVWARPAAANDPLLLVPAPPVAPLPGESVSVQVWSPAIGADSEITVQGAELVKVEVLADDLAVLALRLPPTTVVAERALVVKVRGDSGKADGTVRVVQAPPAAGMLQLSAEPARFRVGVDDAATVRVALPPGLQAPGARAIKLVANVGTIEAAVVDGAAAVARWRPSPDLKASQIVVLSAIDEAAPETLVGALAFPVIVRREVPFPAPAGASVVLTIGERSFGPVTAGADGKALLAVERDPTLTKGRLRIVAPGGAVTESEVELAFGEGPRFSLLPLPRAIAHDPAAPQRVLAYVSGPDGRPWSGAAPEITADKGKVGSVGPGPAPGFFLAPWDTAGASGAATVTVKLDGRAHALGTQLVPSVAGASVTMSTEPSVLLANGSETVATLSPNTALAVFGGAPKPGKLKDPAVVPLTLGSGSDAMALVAAPRGPVSGQPVSRLVVWTPATVAPADGSSRVPVGVVALDADGLPVPNVALKWSVEGAGTVAGLPTTTADGVAVGLYVAGNQVGPVGLSVEAAGIKGLSPLFLQGAGFSPPAGVSGTEAALTERERWRARAPLAVVGRPPGAAMPAVAPMTAADLARLEAEKKAAAKQMKKGASASGGPVGTGAAAAPVGSVDPLSLFGAAPADGLGTARTRVSVGLLAHPRTYAHAADTPPLPGSLEWATPGLLSAPGLDVRATTYAKAWGGELRVRGSTQQVATPFSETAETVTTTEFIVAPVVRGALAPGLCWRASLGVHRYTVPAWAYTDAESPTGLDAEARGANALRVSGGVVIDRERGMLSAELAPSLGEDSANLAIDTVLGVHLGPTWSAQVGWSRDWRSSTPTIEGAEAEIEEQITGMQLGIAYRLP